LRIVLDAMGGDNAPKAEVKGAIAAVKAFKEITVILVGKQQEIEKILTEEKAGQEIRARLQIVNATEVVTMSDEPAKAWKQKTDSSLAVAARYVRDGKGDALVSAGNTGAVLVASLFGIGRIAGVQRPAILSPLPSNCPSGITCLVDAGANVDCKPTHLAQFAIMGDLYSKHIFKVEKPRIGIMSVGEEDEKGNELVFATRAITDKLGLNTIGNIEGRDSFNGSADVIVCDGFVGNVILKTAEGAGSFVLGLIKSAVKSGGPIALLGALLMGGAIKLIKKKTDPNAYGGAPLLGIKKPVIISHGSVSSEGVKNALKVAANWVSAHINEAIESEIKKVEFKSE